MNVGGLFDGAGLLAYGLHRAGLSHRWLCEVDPWRRELLELRFPGVPVYPDIRAVDADAPRVDVIAGGFPYKGASTAGKRNGFEHPETVLWREMARSIRELRPRYVLVENVANLLGVRDGAVWGEVVGDLASLGFDIEWDCFPAAAFGAPHLRDRVIAIATHTDRSDERWERGELGLAGGREDARGDTQGAADAEGARPEGPRLRGWSAERGGVSAPDADDSGRRPGVGDLRERQPDARRSSGATADAPSGRGQGTRRGRQALGGARANDQVAPAISDHEGLDGRSECDGRGSRGLVAGHDAVRLGVPVEWGKYEAAIRRWETVVGRAPEPLCAFRGVDARAASRVERSRLSALGDGVQLQLGELAGRRLLELDRERRMRAAA